MEITEVRVKLMDDSDDRLQAFCSITFDDCFVVRDLKIIEGTNGPFVAMPSRKLTAHCPHCGTKNHLRSVYCNQCGQRLREGRSSRDSEGRTKLYADIAHPINSGCREMIQSRVIEEYRIELDRAQQPGYVSRYDDEFEELDGYDELAVRDERPAAPAAAREPAAPASASEPPAADRPASEPRPPHRTAPRPSQGGSRRTRNDDNFGAGIF